MSEEIKMLEKLIEENEKIFEEVGETYSLTPDVVDTIKSLINEHKELEQMVNIMAKDIFNNETVSLDCETCPKSGNCEETDEECLEIVLEHYKKKAQIELKIIQGLEEYAKAETGSELEEEFWQEQKRLEEVEKIMQRIEE